MNIVTKAIHSVKKIITPSEDRIAGDIILVDIYGEAVVHVEFVEFVRLEPLVWRAEALSIPIPRACEIAALKFLFGERYWIMPVFQERGASGCGIVFQTRRLLPDSKVNFDEIRLYISPWEIFPPPR